MEQQFTINIRIRVKKPFCFLKQIMFLPLEFWKTFIKAPKGRSKKKKIEKDRNIFIYITYIQVEKESSKNQRKFISKVACYIMLYVSCRIEQSRYSVKSQSAIRGFVVYKVLFHLKIYFTLVPLTLICCWFISNYKVICHVLYTCEVGWSHLETITVGLAKKFLWVFP